MKPSTEYYGRVSDIKGGCVLSQKFDNLSFDNFEHSLSRQFESNRSRKSTLYVEEEIEKIHIEAKRKEQELIVILCFT